MPLRAAIAGLIACLLGASVPALAQVARVLETKGTSMVERAGKPARILGRGEQLDERDVISVARDSYAILEFRDQTRITLRPNTVFRLDTYRDTKAESVLFGLLKGGFRAVTGLVAKQNPSAVKFQTATATIGIRGTEFDARLCEDDCAAEERQRPATQLPAAARLVEFRGSVEAVDLAGTPRRLVAGSYVRQADEVRTGRDSHAVFVLRDQGRLVLYPNTRLVFHRFKYEPARPADAEVAFLLRAGRVGTKTGLIGKARPLGYSISTRFGHVETRGTDTEVNCIGDCAEPARRAIDISRIVVDKSRAGRTERPGTPAIVQIPIAATPSTGDTRVTDLPTQQPMTAEVKQSLLIALKSRTTLPPAVPQDWRKQVMTAEAKQALIAFAQQAGIPGASELATAVNSNPMFAGITYEQLQQALLQDNPVAWGPVLSVFAAAGGPDALVTAFNTPVDWHTLPVSAQMVEALMKFAIAMNISSVDATSSMSGVTNYADLQQAMQDNGATWGPLLELFAGANSAEALLTAFNALLAPETIWRLQPVSAEAKQAMIAYVQQNGAPGDAAGLEGLFNMNSGITYAQLRQLFEENASLASWIAPLAGMIAGAASPDALVIAADWHKQVMTAEAKQALIAFAQQAGIPGADQLASALSSFPNITYEQMQQALLQDNPVNWGPIIAMLAGASNPEALVAAANAPQTQAAFDPEQQGMEVSVTEGAVEVTTTSGTQTVEAGQVVSVPRPESLLVPAFMQKTKATARNIQMPGIDTGTAFGDESAADTASGLYVWVRDGAVQLSKDGVTLDVTVGNAALATADRIVPLDTVPNFMRFDQTPRPTQAGSERASDAFRSPDGSQSLMCTVR